jgi:hypothetical protein
MMVLALVMRVRGRLKTSFQLELLSRRGLPVRNLHWKRVYEAHRALLFGDALTIFAPVSIDGPQMLFDMDVIFEKYVYKLFKDSLPFAVRYKGETRPMLRDVGKRKLALKPDIFITKDRDTVLLADAKWKFISNHLDIDLDDIRQLFAYCKIWKIKRGLLVYPSAEDRFQCSWESTNEVDSVEIGVCRLPVGAAIDPAKIASVLGISADAAVVA